MSRNDASLYTGLTSPARREVIEHKEQVAKPDPKAEAVLSIIAQDKEDLFKVDNLVLGDEVSDDVKLRQLERVKDRYNYICELERKFKFLFRKGAQ